MGDIYQLLGSNWHMIVVSLAGKDWRIQLELWGGKPKQDPFPLVHFKLQEKCIAKGFCISEARSILLYQSMLFSSHCQTIYLLVEVNIITQNEEKKPKSSHFTLAIQICSSHFLSLIKVFHFQWSSHVKYNIKNLSCLNYYDGSLVVYCLKQYYFILILLPVQLFEWLTYVCKCNPK